LNIERKIKQVTLVLRTIIIQLVNWSI